MLEVTDLSVGTIGPVSFSVSGGECVVLTGPSGSGKSRLLRAIADLDPNRGSVRWSSIQRETTPAPDWRRRVGYLPAESGWWRERVGAHFPADLSTSLLPDLGLPAEALGWPVLRLSTGERQRLALARLIANEPDVFLLDEPTSALDDDNAGLVEAVLKTLLARGAAVLLVSHNRAQAERMADRRLTLTDGRLVGDPT